LPSVRVRQNSEPGRRRIGSFSAHDCGQNLTRAGSDGPYGSPHGSKGAQGVLPHGMTLEQALHERAAIPVLVDAVAVLRESGLRVDRRLELCA
jgi:hypothetical protein